MTLFESLISGLVQGLTEFLPVSSSGHLVLVHSFFGAEEPDIFFDICLHLATLGAVLVFFRKDIIALFTRAGSKLAFLVAVATLPAVAAGLLIRKHMDHLFQSPRAVSFMLIGTALVLLAGHSAMKRLSGGGKKPGLLSSINVGLAQVLALLPGISRSGVTISAGLLAGVKAEDSFKFSFLMAIPVIAGAALHEVISGGAEALEPGVFFVYAAGMVAAFVSGLFGLSFLLKVIRASRLWVFSVYCFLAGAAGLFIWK
jgi:undecaprenyl-diphosphatase